LRLFPSCHPRTYDSLLEVYTLFIEMSTSISLSALWV
jgi:hypothetical protein